MRTLKTFRCALWHILKQIVAEQVGEFFDLPQTEVPLATGISVDIAATTDAAEIPATAANTSSTVERRTTTLPTTSPFTSTTERATIMNATERATTTTSTSTATNTIKPEAMTEGISTPATTTTTHTKSEDFFSQKLDGKFWLVTLV